MIQCLQLLDELGGLSRQELSRQLGIRPTTAGIFVRTLIDAELIVERYPLCKNTGRGRPTKELNLNQNGAYFLGLHVSKKSISCSLVDFSMNLLNQATCMNQCNDDLGLRLAALIDDVIDQSRIRNDRIYGIGTCHSDEIWGCNQSVTSGLEALRDEHHSKPVYNWVITAYDEPAAQMALSRHIMATKSLDNDSSDVRELNSSICFAAAMLLRKSVFTNSG